MIQLFAAGNEELPLALGGDKVSRVTTSTRTAGSGAWTAAIISVALVISACSGNYGNPTSVTDTTGEGFTWTCRSDGCSAESESGLTVACWGGPNQGFMYFRSRFVVLCPAYRASGFATTLGHLCRIVACEHSSECPQFEGALFECENGLCQREGHDDTLRSDDVIALCLADVPRPENCEEFDPLVEQAYADAEASCGTELGAVCEWLPDGCRAP
jgi:hypothetical protein